MNSWRSGIASARRDAPSTAVRRNFASSDSHSARSNFTSGTIWSPAAVRKARENSRNSGLAPPCRPSRFWAHSAARRGDIQARARLSARRAAADESGFGSITPASERGNSLGGAGSGLEIASFFSGVGGRVAGSGRGRLRRAKPMSRSRRIPTTMRTRRMDLPVTKQRSEGRRVERRGLDDGEVLFDVGFRFHANQRCRHARGGAGELNRAGGVGREARELRAHGIGQAAEQLALQERDAREDGDPELARRAEERGRLSLDLLRRDEERLGHPEVERELDDFESVLRAARLARAGDDALQRQPVVALHLAEAVPGRDAVRGELSLVRALLEFAERGGQASIELLLPHRGELALGIVDVVDVEGLDAEILAALVDLVAQVRGRHAVRLVDEVVERRDALVDERPLEPRHRVGGRLAFEREVAALGAEQDLIAREFARIDTV